MSAPGRTLPLRAAAIQFLIDAYEGARVRPGKGPPHAQTVADVLRDAGSDEITQIAGLLHDVVEDTPRTLDDVRATFGETIAATVAALTEDDSIEPYADRKRALREQMVDGGPRVLAVALADKIATLRHALVTGTEVSTRKADHYRAVLEIGRAAGGPEALCDELELLLAEIAPR